MPGYCPDPATCDVFACRLPLRAHMAMAEAVLDLKQRVVWQLALPEHEQLLAAYLPLRHAKHSILVQQHLPMHTVLSHPNVHSLVSDGSMQSIHAAIFYAKPLAAVALNAEQRDNVARLTVLGIGRQLERSEIETGLASFRLSIALERLTNVYSYKQRIQTLSVRMHASLPLGATPMQRAAEAIDFVLTMAQAQQQDDATQARDSAKHVHIGSPDDLLLWMQTVHGAGYAGWMQGHNADVWVLLLWALLACLLGCAFIFHICTRMPAGALAANKDKKD